MNNIAVKPDEYWLYRLLGCTIFALFAANYGAAANERVRPWSPIGISSELFESHAAFDPQTGDVYFVRSSKTFAGWRILRTRCTRGQWEPPSDAPFAGAGVEADPYFTPDGRSVYFISTRATGSQKSSDLDIWRADRADGRTWRSAIRLPEPVNSNQSEWFPRPSRDGWLYFGSNRVGGLGGNDIWRARQSKFGGWRVENLGSHINTAGDEYEPLPSPDGRRLIIGAGDGLYESLSRGRGWTQRTRMNADVNANGSELGAAFSPSGRSLLFARDTGEPKSGEFFVLSSDPSEPWPSECGEN